MARVQLVRNPRYFTILLLALTFILGGIAIFAAISLSNRNNVNPTPSSAAETCTEVRDEFYANCCENINNDPSANPPGDPALGGTCTDYWAGNYCGPESDKVFRACEAQSGQPTATPTAVAGDPTPTSTGSLPNCDVNNSSECRCENNPCPAGSFCDPLNSFQCMPGCTGDANNPVCFCGSKNNICRSGTNVVGPSECGDVDGVPGNDQFECRDLGAGGFQQGEVCSFPVGGDYDQQCLPATFRANCSPGAGEMCVCRGTRLANGQYRIRNGVVYGTEVGAIPANDTNCLRSENITIDDQGRCFDKNGNQLSGIYSGNREYTTCGNTIFCRPPETTPTPTAPPTGTPTPTATQPPAQTGSVSVNAVCINNDNNEVAFTEDFRLDIDIPDTANGKFLTRNSRSLTYNDLPIRASYYVRLANLTNTGLTIRSTNCNADIANGGSCKVNLGICDTNEPPPPTSTPTPTSTPPPPSGTPTPTPPTQITQCIDMFIDGNLRDKVMRPGDEATVVLRVQNPTQTVDGGRGSAVIYNRDNVSNGAILQAKVNNLNPAGFSPMENTTSGVGTKFVTPGTYASNIGTYTFRVNYEQLFQNDQNYNNQLLQNIQLQGLAGGTSRGVPACQVNFARVNPPICTDLEVSKTTGIIQGETLEVRVVSSDPANVTYNLNSSFDVSNLTRNPNDPSRFTVKVPNNAELESFTLQGSVSREGLTSAPPECRFAYTFDNTPDIDKELDAPNSTNINTTNTNYVIVNNNSEVEYDLAITNNGENVMQNLIVVDYVEAFNPNNNNSPINPAIGDIKSATDLTRTTGTLSNPSPVQPRVPSGNGPYAVGTKRVEWRRIDALYPGEAYTGSVRVDVLDFTDTQMLRNNVCLYRDTNNNGQYDENIDEELRCDHVDVYTGQPQITVIKQAFILNSETPANVVKPGDKFTYRVTVTNTSPTAVSNITVTDTFDQAFLSKFNISNISDGGQIANNVITWTVPGPIASGATKVLTFEAEVKADFFNANPRCSEVVRNNVQSRLTTPNYTTPVYEMYVTVVNKTCSEEFTIIKSVNPSVVAPSGTVTYTSNITNVGTKSAPIVRIVDDYADSFSYVAGTATFTRPDGTTFKKDPEVANGKLTWNFATAEQVTLAPSQSLGLTYQIRASATSGTYPNVICLESPVGGCDDAVVIISVNPTNPPVVIVTQKPPVLPNNGITVGDSIKILGIGMLGIGILSYIASNKRNRLDFNAFGKTKVVTRKQKSLDDKIKDTISRLKK